MGQPDPSESIGNMVAKYQPDFALVLPPSIPAAMFVRLAQGRLRSDDKLRAAAKANPISLFTSLMECARLGHEPGTEEYALVPFNSWNKELKKNVPEVVGIEQYQGMIERMLNSGAVMSVRAEVVRENDLFDPREDEPYGLPIHKPGWYTTDPPGTSRHPWFISDDDRGDLVGVYAYAVMDGGAISRVVKMGRDEVMRHKAVAKTDKFWVGPWEQDMWLKTAIRRLTDFVPTSAEQAARRAERLRVTANASTPGLATVTPTPADQGDTGQHSGQGDVVDAQVVSEETA